MIKKYVNSFPDPHHSVGYNKNQSISQVSHSPPKSDDPISHALEALYVENTIVKGKGSVYTRKSYTYYYNHKTLKGI